jgi:threonine/homoserine/homoserine lactone efflux protein
MSLGSSVLSFALVAGLLTIIPGLDTAMVLRATLRNGRGHGFAAALGVNCGALVWGAGAALGVSALLEVSSVAYAALRIAGAGYMLWLGSRLLWQAVRRSPPDELASADPVAASPRLAQSWSRGLMTNLLNPKIGAFYVSVLPQFIPPHSSHLAVGLLLAGVHDLEGLAWFTMIILAAHTARRLLARRRTQQAIDALTGTVLIGFGLRLGLSSR